MRPPLGPVRALARPLRAALRSFGPRRTAVLAGAILLAGAGAAVALTSGASNGSHAKLASAPSSSAPTSTQAISSSATAPGGGAKQQPHRAAKRSRRAATTKPAAKQIGGGRAHSALQQAASRQTSSSTSTTQTASATSTTTSTTTTTPTPSHTIVSLDVHGGGNSYVVECGYLHHFRTYPTGSTLSFTGAIRPVPRGPWKVELHIKVCQGGAWQDFEKIEAQLNTRTGAFHGTFIAPASGMYDVIPVLYLGSVESKQGDDVHVETQ